VKKPGLLKDWVAAVMASGRALYSPAELHLMRNAVAWQEDQLLVERAAALEAELAKKQLELAAAVAAAQTAEAAAQTAGAAALAAARAAAPKV
jgi:hypothetical protein